MIKLNVALAGVVRIGFDTSPFIYFVERNLNYVDLVRAVFQQVTAGTIQGYSSVVTLTEVLTQPKRTGNTVVEQIYQHVLLNSQHFSLVPVDTIIAERAASLRAQFTLRTPDALQIATALATGCTAFLTNDRQLQRVTALRVLVLDELEL